MKKVLYTLNVNDYAKDITDMTYPLLRNYADKIGAEFQIISTRKYPDWPVVYEKLQIFELGKDNDWNIYIDSDAVVHPDLFDVTEHLTKDQVLHNGRDLAGNRWKYDNYFRRDKRHIGSCNWFTVASNWCIDLWHPLDISLEEAVSNIYPTVSEVNSNNITPDHLIDDYTLSRNIAKYGLHFTTLTDILNTVDPKGNYLWHQYTISVPEKVQAIKDVLVNWKLISPSVSVPDPSVIV